MFNKKLKQENSRLTQELLNIKQELSIEKSARSQLAKSLNDINIELNKLKTKNTLLNSKLKQTDFDDLNKKLAFSRQELIKVNEEMS